MDVDSINSLSNELKIRREGPVGVIVLDRTNMLNALSLEMIRVISAALRHFQSLPDVRAVVFGGATDKAFCSGGDMKSVYKSGMAYRREEVSVDSAALFFEEEYALNRTIYEYDKPVITLMNGLTMGGGYGIAGPSKFSIATNSTIFAMPEVLLGFFPDVGAAHFLNKCPEGFGLYLALTGARIGGQDMVAAGLATHYAPCVELEELVNALSARLMEGGDDDASEAINAVLSELSGAERASADIENLADIKRCFQADEVEGILAALEETEWGRGVKNKMLLGSPTSLKVIYRYMQECAGLSYQDVLARDLCLARAFIAGHDFYEGVRSVLLHKDHSPVWEPDRLEDVSGEMVESYFEAADK